MTRVAALVASHLIFDRGEELLARWSTHRVVTSLTVTVAQLVDHLAEAHRGRPGRRNFLEVPRVSSVAQIFLLTLGEAARLRVFRRLIIIVTVSAD